MYMYNCDQESAALRWVPAQQMRVWRDVACLHLPLPINAGPNSCNEQFPKVSHNRLVTDALEDAY